MAAHSRNRKPRDPRVRNQPDRARGYVTYTAAKDSISQPRQGAQFVDVSASGMRLISRQPNQIHLGDRIKVDFTLPGATTRTVLDSTVVRRENEYEFAVTFMHREPATRDSLIRAIQSCRDFFEQGFVVQAILRGFAWAKAHRQGLMIAAAGLILIGGAAYFIVVNSDEYLHKPLRPWGKIYPKQWFLDYFKK